MDNRTFRLFISSTFYDFILERDLLNSRIYTDVNDFCKTRGYNFQLIDLRWGVSHEAAYNQNTMAICMDEVRRCRELSPKPNFLFMLGDRYGWIPLPVKIKKNSFERVLDAALEYEKEALTCWYHLDNNSIGGEYYLASREKEYLDEDIWRRKESELREALFSCAKRCELSDDDIPNLTISATEQEIMEGFLRDDCDGGRNVIALFRDGFPEGDIDDYRIKSLRGRIEKRLCENECEKNIIKLHYADDETYGEAFCSAVYTMLTDRISEEIARIEQLKANQGEETETYHETTRGDIFLFRNNEMRLIDDYVNGNENKPLLITGKSGSGKTSLLAEYYNNLNSSDKFSAFFGMNVECHTLIGTVSAGRN